MDMIKKEFLQKVRKIQIKVKKYLTGAFNGDSKTRVKGDGFEFEQLRDYIEGDDVRLIDWKSSARMNKTLIRQYLDDKNRIVLLMIDVSASCNYGRKKEMIFDICSIIALAALFSKDVVGFILFDDKVVKFIPPSSALSSIILALYQIYENKFDTKSTDMESAMQEIMGKYKKKSIFFVISDFLGDTFSNGMKIISKKHDLIAIRCLEELETEFIDAGFLTTLDSENKFNTQTLLPFNNNKLKLINSFLKNQKEAFEKFCKSFAIDLVDIDFKKSFFVELLNCFARRRLR